MARSLDHGVTSGEDIQLGGVLGTPQVNEKTVEADEKGQSFHSFFLSFVHSFVLSFFLSFFL